MKNLENYRKTYEKSELLESFLPKNPMDLFEKWFLETEQSNTIEEVNAMSIATIGLDGYPKTRVVLLKAYTENGFVFYTNYQSEKGKAILANPKVCLSFFWPSQERQIIIKGIATKTSTEVSDQYFKSRPAGSQIGAIVSNQSEVIKDRNFLESKLTDLENFYQENQIERPENWGGFIIKPTEIEFWQGRPNRLHDRIRYKMQSDFSWISDRLSP